MNDDAGRSGRPVSLAELAGLIGISERHARFLAERRVFVRIAPGRYDAVASARAYCARLRADAAEAGRPVSATAGITAERVRQAKEKADALALQNEQRRRELLPAAEVAALGKEVAATITARMMQVPDRLRAKGFRAEDLQVLAEEIRDALAPAERLESWPFGGA